MSQFIIEEAQSLQTFAAMKALLAHELIRHAQLDELLAHRLERHAKTPRFLIATKQDEAVAFSTFGPLIHLSEGSHRALKALGSEAARRAEKIRLVSGTPESVDDFIRGYQEHRVLPVIAFELERQVLILRKKPRLDSDEKMTVRFATANDHEFIGEGLSSLILSEFGYDPRKRHNFGDQISAQITAQRWWIGENDQPRMIIGKGVVTPTTFRLDNVWVAPNSRRLGYGTRGMKIVASELLRNHSSVSLSVTTGNIAAQHLYKRLGFESHGSHRLVFFQREGSAEGIDL